MTQNKVSLMGKYVVLCYKSLVKRAEKVGLFWAQLYVTKLWRGEPKRTEGQTDDKNSYVNSEVLYFYL